MAFFDKGSATPVKDTILSYSYPPCTLYNSGSWEKKISERSSNYNYKITYPDDNKGASLTYVTTGVPPRYKPKKMYIYG